ncbi:hypothetical protein UFOVP116_156 [uncultured Caudovirales phage]|uniref:Uncharacterized protein n=1 Tax=uncultured Caudovirales phage TaxID=2100421 RepID=A0A6J5L980_9CAUD|nr:hypothetical protein UFOVP116_156 [uncultured Caudovirales phage]
MVDDDCGILYHNLNEEIDSIQMSYQVTFTKQIDSKLSSMEQWCSENVGKGGWIFSAGLTFRDSLWSIDAIYGGAIFCFRHREHYIMFLLRWC